ncbi:MAG TPA: hypothetical protein VG826_24200 [Pirellulales bacterium]|nr:hypothetical protein [Pirellulales bacterium]
MAHHLFSGFTVSVAAVIGAAIGKALVLHGDGPMRWTLAVAFCLVGSVVLADDSLERLKAIWDKRQKWLVRTEGARNADQQFFDHSYDKPDKDPVRALQKAIAAEEKHLDELQSNQKSTRNPRERTTFKRKAAASQKLLKDLQRKLAEAVEKKANEPDEEAPSDDLTVWPPIEFEVGQVGTLPLFPAAGSRRTHQPRRAALRP